MKKINRFESQCVFLFQLNANNSRRPEEVLACGIACVEKIYRGVEKAAVTTPSIRKHTI
jgi:hypothetical protein